MAYSLQYRRSAARGRRDMAFAREGIEIPFPKMHVFVEPMPGTGD